MEKVHGKALFLFLLCAAYLAEYTWADKKSKGVTYKPSKVCEKNHPFMKKYPQVKKTCCSYVNGKMSNGWTAAGYHLTSYLSDLEAWNCTEFYDECVYRPYAFTNFTKAVYSRFCNKTQFMSQCFSSISKLHHENNNISYDMKSRNITVTEADWISLITPLSDLSIADSSFQEPCVQVAMYDIPERGPYHEVINVLVPFCGFVWCGMGTNVNDFDGVSDWTCLPTRCRVNMIIIVIIICVMSVFVIVANTVVITVFMKSEKLWNGQALYKISIALADSLVGVVVLPSFVSTFYLFIWQKHNHSDKMWTMHSHQTDNASEESSGYLNSVSLDRDFIFSDSERAPLWYFDFVGFFTTLSLSVSVYTLVAAAIDRLLAIAMPMNYFKHNTKRIAKYVIISIWIIAAIFSIIPPIVEGLEYSVVASTLISLSGGNAPIIYAVIFILPLLTVWGTSIALFISMKKHAKKAKEVRNHSAPTNELQTKIEKKLAQTLGLMVGIYTLNLFPAIAVLIAGLIWSNVHYNNLEDLSEVSASAYISLEFLAVIVLMSNSLWNCFIYSVKNEDFRNEARQVVKRSTDLRRLLTKKFRANDTPVVYNNYREQTVDFETQFTNPNVLDDNGVTAMTNDGALNATGSPNMKAKPIFVRRYTE
ncbi:uncharacterized protein LOC120331683 [Styela clava]